MNRLKDISSKRVRRWCAVFMTAIVCAVIGFPAAVAVVPAYNNLSAMTNSELIARGVEYINADTLNDMAVATLTTVVNRYYENQTDTAARKAAVKALNHLGNLYMTHEIDYRQAYKSLVLGRQIAEEDDNLYELAHIYNGLANLYYYNADGKEEMHTIAYDFINKAADAAMRSHNETMIPYIAQNMAIITYEDDDWGPFSDVIKRIMAYEPLDKATEESQDWKCMRLIVSGADNMYNGHYSEAQQQLREAVDKIGSAMYTERKFFTINYLLIHLYEKTGQLDQATALVKSLLRKAIEGEFGDFELSMYADLANLYEKWGIPDSVDVYYNKYLNLKSVFEEQRGFRNVETLDLRSEVERINKEVEQLSVMRQKAKREKLILIFTLIILTVICVAMAVVHLNLRRNHRRLFEKNEEMRRLESMHRMAREQWEVERAELLARNGTAAPAEVLTSVDNADALPKRPEAGQDDNESEVGGDMLRLFSRIMEVMEKSAEIYKTKFSLNDLADMLGVTPRSVSRAINICYKGNFHQLLNDYRIREVSRIMAEEGAANLTIESLAEQAGFSSRTYFATIFKKATGLTPSEYLKIANKTRR